MNLSMDDEDDTYGFGSFSDLFDGASATTSNTSRVASSHINSSSDAHASLVVSASTLLTADTTKQLDVRAMSHLWVSERALASFEQQRRRDHMREFQHVAAKFDGVTIEGGLGSVFYVQSF